MQALKPSPKKIYQFILSSKQPSEGLRDALAYLLKRTVDAPEHFDFLLHRVNWFEPPFTNYQPLFLKILRIYRSKSKQSSKVIYNLLIESFTSPASSALALQCLAELFAESYDKRAIIQCLKENYPHKLCSVDTHVLYLDCMLQLCGQFKDYRMDFLEIIIENLVNFDTELVLADDWVHRPFPEDQKIVALRDQPLHNEISQKFDQLLSTLLQYLGTLEQDEKIIGEMLLVFQNKVLPIKTTKLIQFIIFSIAESSKARANTFISFLLGNIFDHNHKENFYRIFTQSNFYLFSYILRSKKLTQTTTAKILRIMIDKLQQKLQQIPELEVNDRTNLKQLYLQNEMSLIVLQTIIVVRISCSSDNVELAEEYAKLMGECHRKLRFQYFLREDILQKINISRKENKTNATVKFSNKFLPATLPSVGKLIDPKMKLYDQPCPQLPSDQPCLLPSDLRQFQPICRKLHKGQTPMSYCSQTIIV